MWQKYKEDNNLDFFMEVSAKSWFNAQKVFVESAKLLYIDYLRYKDKVDKSRSSSVHSSIIKRHSLSQTVKASTPKEEEKPKKWCSC